MKKKNKITNVLEALEYIKSVVVEHGSDFMCNIIWSTFHGYDNDAITSKEVYENTMDYIWNNIPDWAMKTLEKNPTWVDGDRECAWAHGLSGELRLEWLNEHIKLLTKTE